MTNRYLIVIDTGKSTFDCYAKTLKTAKGKITRFVNNYPHKIESAVVYENHKEIFRK